MWDLKLPGSPSAMHSLEQKLPVVEALRLASRMFVVLVGLYEIDSSQAGMYRGLAPRKWEDSLPVGTPGFQVEGVGLHGSYPKVERHISDYPWKTHT